MSSSSRFKDMPLRRDFCGGLLGGLLASQIQAAAAAQPARILLRSSWQVVNIGDIAHTPGVLALIQKYLPRAEVRLWASGDLSPEVADMEHRRFPNLQIVKGTIASDGQASTQDLAETLQWCDFLLHGSGPSLVASRDVAAFERHVQKPFGVYGITYAGGNPEQVALLSRAQFAYFRDSVSLEKARSDGVSSPIVEFTPDGAFACDLRNDSQASAWLEAHQLQPGKYVCCIPRLRYTPYWLIRPGSALDPQKDARNQEMAEHDHAVLRRAIERIVRETDLKVLIVPEDRTQMQVGRQWLWDRLPADVRTRVVWRESFWLTDEALSTYVRSAGLFGLEMHSPIMCIGNGIPAIVGRFAEQTSKGWMWKDIGLEQWLFDLDDEAQAQRYPDAVIQMLTDQASSRAQVAQAQHRIRQWQAASMSRLAAAG